MEFSDLGLREALVRKCEYLNFYEPTPIQEKAIPVILKGSDLIGCAETGTGKTAAFLLPAIQNLTERFRPGIRVLVIAPTRELASQIAEAHNQLASKRNPCANLIGGASLKRQCDALRRRVSVVVATPGRLIDHIERGSVDLANIDVLVLDEADRMLDMGFMPSIRRILTHLPNSRQTLLFSATMSDSVRGLAYSMMRDPKVIEVSRRNRTARMVRQAVYSVAAHSKTALLLDLLETNNFERVLVFTATKRGAERLAHILKARGLRANEIHSNRSQSQREKALQGFRTGKIRILVATDIASRGIDVDLVSHVINYDVPQKPEDYVHRVGRTGRAGNEGRAITLVTPIEGMAMREIERLTEQSIERIVVPDPGTSGANGSAAGAGGKKALENRSSRDDKLGTLRLRRA